MFKCTGHPTWIFPKSEIKHQKLEISKPGKRPLNFLKIALDLLSHFFFLLNNK